MRNRGSEPSRATPRPSRAFPVTFRPLYIRGRTGDGGSCCRKTTVPRHGERILRQVGVRRAPTILRALQVRRTQEGCRRQPAQGYLTGRRQATPSEARPGRRGPGVLRYPGQLVPASVDQTPLAEALLRTISIAPMRPGPRRRRSASPHLPKLDLVSKQRRQGCLTIASRLPCSPRNADGPASPRSRILRSGRHAQRECRGRSR